ncbi:MORC family CW-type zinc finger protein 3 [Eucyclogobius newberryi]|uniref:MORC family CW-type zinc finger protein 3 n=1 Tax=Eucyclogobius newberryi TaxID=166745 RepID=UPI003B5B334E
MAKYTEQGIRLSSTCPIFLNSNSTSHIWPFSAVAELIDNAADPGVFAKQIWIDIHIEAGLPCMTFIDNGSGMTPNKLHKMLSFGFTDKGGGRAGAQAIGVYGNGFKSGSMRLGRDALIFTKNGGCQSVGMLSQTFLETIKAQCVIVPIVPFNQQKSLVVTEDSEASLAAILNHSLVSSQAQIQAHFDSIPSNKGTKILIWNLRRANDGNPEIDFGTDTTDFRLPEIQIKELNRSLKNSELLKPEQNVPEMYYSLKEYLSILYLRPRIHVILRGAKIPSKLVSQQLTHVEYDVYNPQFTKDKVKVTFGINKTNREDYGIMMYHKNRLIKAYEKVGCQLKACGRRAGVGVIGIIECDFLKPAHNKQDFEYTKEYRLTLSALGMKLNDYWKEVMERKRAIQREYEAVAKEQENTNKGNTENGPTWLQCDECLKWRTVPVGHYSVIPENWSCSQNPNPRYRSCSSQEEMNDTEDLLTASYPKNHYKREHSRNKKRERSPKLVESGSKSLAHCFSDPEMSCEESRDPKPLSPPLTKEAENMDMSTEQGPEAASTTTSLTSESITVIKDTAHATQLHRADASESSSTRDLDQSQDTPAEQEETGQKHDTRDLERYILVIFWISLELARQEKHLFTMCFAPQHDNSWEFTVMMLLTAINQLCNTFCCSSKRKSGEPIQRVEKKLCLYEEQVLSKEDVSNSGISDKTNKDCKSQEENQGVDLRLVTREDSREARVKRLEELESESHKLRQLLGLEVIKKTHGSLTTADTESPKKSTVRTREIGCQAELTEMAVSCGSKTPVSKYPEALIQSSLKESGFKDLEKKKKNENLKSTGNEDHNSTPVLDKLHDIRNNVVVLLTSLLPQLDLSDISLETADVDNILQQIIEVNELKL